MIIKDRVEELTEMSKEQKQLTVERTTKALKLLGTGSKSPN